MLVSAPIPTPKTVALPGFYPRDQTGSAWLLDDERPVRPRRVKTGQRLDAAAAARDVRLLPDLVRDAYAWPDRSFAGESIDSIAERHAIRIERNARNGTIVAAEVFRPVMRDLFAKLNERHMGFSVGGTQLDPVADDDVFTREFRGPADAIRGAAAVTGALPHTAEVVTRSGPGGVGRIGSLAVRGVEGLAELERLGYAPVADARVAAGAVSSPAEVYSSRTIGDVAVIRLRQLWFGTDQEQDQLEQFVADASEHAKAKAIVLDMRGNGGGNDGYILRWASRMLPAGTSMPWPTRERYASGRHEKIALWNTTTSYGNDPRDPSDDAWFEEGQATKALWPLDERTPLGAVDDTPAEAEGPGGFRGKLVVLVDRDSASSAESGSIFLRDWMKATIAGERTGGFVEGANVVTYPLPNTRIGFTIPSRQSHWNDPRVVEAAGIPISVALDDPHAPVEQLLGQLRPWLGAAG